MQLKARFGVLAMIRIFNRLVYDAYGILRKKIP
jgi:hypothetical protein